MENPEKGNVFAVVKEFISTVSHFRTLSLLFLLLIIAAVPLTVFVAQQRQETRQRASIRVATEDTYCRVEGTTALDRGTCGDRNIEAICVGVDDNGNVVHDTVHTGYYWKANCSQSCNPGDPSACGGGDSNWCYGFVGNQGNNDNKCLHLEPIQQSQDCRTNPNICTSRGQDCDQSTGTCIDRRDTTCQNGDFGKPCEYNDNTPTKVCDNNNSCSITVGEECDPVGGANNCARSDDCRSSMCGNRVRRCIYPPMNEGGDCVSNGASGTCQRGTCRVSGSTQDCRTNPSICNVTQQCDQNTGRCIAIGGQQQTGTCEEKGCGNPVREYDQCGGDIHTNCDNDPDDNVGPATSRVTVHVKEYRCSGVTYWMSSRVGEVSGRCGVSVRSACPANLKPRFQKADGSTDWMNPLQNIPIRQNIKAAVFTGDGTVNAGPAVTATVKDPDGSTVLTFTPDERNNMKTFTPEKRGTYTLTATCAAVTERATLVTTTDCDKDAVNMTVRSVSATSSNDIFVNDLLKFTVSGTQGNTHQQDIIDPVTAVNLSGGFFDSNSTYRAQSAGRVTWTRKWRNCYGSTTNCTAEVCTSNPFTFEIKARPEFTVSGRIFLDNNGNGTDDNEPGAAGLKFKAVNETSANNTKESNITRDDGNFVINNVPQGERYRGEITGGVPAGKYVTTAYPVRGAVTNNITNLKIGLKDGSISASHLVKGQVKTINCGSGLIEGWVCDPDNYGEKAKVNIFDYNGLKIAENLVANEDSTDGETNCGTDPQNKKHGFKQLLPSSLRDGREHTIIIYGKDIRGTDGSLSPDRELEGSPKTFNCRNAADLNGDGLVNILDANILLTKWRNQDLSGCSGVTSGTGCANLDGINGIDERDFNLWIISYLATTGQQ